MNANLRGIGHRGTQAGIDEALIEQSIGVSTPTANVLIREFQKLGLLVEVTGQLRGRASPTAHYLAQYPAIHRA